MSKIIIKTIQNLRAGRISNLWSWNISSWSSKKCSNPRSQPDPGTKQRLDNACRYFGGRGGPGGWRGWWVGWKIILKQQKNQIVLPLAWKKRITFKGSVYIAQLLCFMLIGLRRYNNLSLIVVFLIFDSFWFPPYFLPNIYIYNIYVYCTWTVLILINCSGSSWNRKIVSWFPSDPGTTGE